MPLEEQRPDDPKEYADWLRKTYELEDATTETPGMLQRFWQGAQEYYERNSIRTFLEGWFQRQGGRPGPSGTIIERGGTRIRGKRGRYSLPSKINPADLETLINIMEE